ncbi:MAG: molybdate ABC transporter substrate-binding protein [Alphaproteobacteria bacterium]|nr:molybdate ABC transporter substrate-binding protein [Alphaproteobacteria bacterium]
MRFNRSRRAIVLAALGTLFMPAAAVQSRAAEPVRIFAAATLQEALNTAMTAAQTALHVPVVGVYGPSPSLVKQLENGAPGDILFSADAHWMDEAVKRKVVDPATRVDLLSSRLVLIAPAVHATATTIRPGFPLAAMLGNGRLAMCDPMMMPAGRYGRAALQKLGVWNSVKGRVVDAADVRAALAYVARQEAQLGIVFDTDARLDPGVKIVGTFPANTTPPIVFPIAAVAQSRNPNTAAVLRFLASPSAKPIFEKFGYVVLPAP